MPPRLAVTTQSAQQPPFPIPKKPTAPWTPARVIPYVKTGMLIELSTIPLYLYSMYSIKPDGGGGGTQARAVLRGVVQQEMLHLSLTGNLLCALNGSMNLYDYGVIPQYPGQILVQKINMNLDRANKENLECFLQIEAPDTPRPQPLNRERGLLPKKQSADNSDSEDGARIAPDYKSIGDFYEDLEKGLKALPGSDFAHNPDKQFSGLDFFDNQMVVITDQASALKALTTIIEQGEGNVAVPDCHYTVFVNLYLNRGAWTVFKVPKNPKTADYKGHSAKEFVWKLSLAFDAGFCYLLQTIQRVWETGRETTEIVLRLLLLRNIHAIMTHILTPIADILVQQKLTNSGAGLVAAPCFNYYPLKDDGTRRLKSNRRPEEPLGPEALHKALVEQVSTAKDASPSDDVKKSLEEMQEYIEKRIPPK